MSIFKIMLLIYKYKPVTPTHGLSLEISSWYMKTSPNSNHNENNTNYLHCSPYTGFSCDMISGCLLASSGMPTSRSPDIWRRERIIVMSRLWIWRLKSRFSSKAWCLSMAMGWGTWMGPSMSCSSSMNGIIWIMICWGWRAMWIICGMDCCQWSVVGSSDQVQEIVLKGWIVRGGEADLRLSSPSTA